MADKRAQADFLSMFWGTGETNAKGKPKEENKTAKKTETAIPFLSLEDEEQQNKERYTFALTPRARQRLTIIRKKYKKRSDSAFLEELIDQIWENLPKE